MKTIIYFALSMVFSVSLLGQNIDLGFKDSIPSKILNENRKFFIKLPKGYNQCDKSYPVIYRLDGDLDLHIETLGTIQRLVKAEEVLPEMIVVMIENTNRNRDMMPTKTSFFKSEPGAENFILFIKNELIPHINRSYRTTEDKILCGQSLSAIFTLYFFLSHSNTFNAYIACSAGFPECEAYFMDLTHKFLKENQHKKKKLFLSHGLKDFLDPDGIIKNQLIDFSNLIESEESIEYQLKIYEDEGHVPFQSLYHGLKFIYK